MSVVTAAPYTFYEIWRFVSPALYPNERKGVRKALGIGTVMFFIGVLLGYFMVYPLTLRFLSTYQLSAANRESNFPELVHRQFHDVGALHGTGIRTAAGDMAAFPAGTGAQDLLRKYRRHAVVIIVIASAIITPTGESLP